MTLHERWIGDVTIIDIDGRMTVDHGADPIRGAVAGIQHVRRRRGGEETRTASGGMNVDAAIVPLTVVGGSAAALKK